MVGAVGRTDLCGPDLAEPLAHEMFHSLRRLDGLPDDLRRLPDPRRRLVLLGARRRRPHDHARRASGPPTRCSGSTTRTPSSSSCSPGSGRSRPTSRRLPELNRRGPRLYPQLPRLDRLDVDAVDRHVAAGALIVDARPIAEFAAGHVPGSISIALRPVFASWLGWLVDLDRPVVFVAGADQDRDELVRQCLDVGHDNIVGELDGGIDAWRAAGRPIDGDPARRPGRHRRRP